MKRSYGRNANQLRPLSFTYNFFDFASGSVFLTLGRTKVACAVNLVPKVPPFLKGKKTGWLTAEYAMLPAATKHRTERESSSFKRNGRSVEISRLIGRSLRSSVNLDLLGERTIMIDCDVIQADGSTRVACITAASLALKAAVDKWLEQGLITDSIIQEEIAAVSVGVRGDDVLLDLDFFEDSSIDADFNIVLTKSGKLVELQGAAETDPISWDHIDTLKTLAIKGVQDIFAEVAAAATQTQRPHAVTKNPFNKIRLKEQ